MSTKAKNSKPDFYIQILGKVHKVFLTKDAEDSGEYEASTREIKVNNSQNDTEKMATLIHESIHGVLSVTGIDQTIDGDLENIICESIASFMLEAFSVKLKEKKE